MPTPYSYVATSGRVTWRVRFRLDDKQCSETFATERQARAFCSDIATRDPRYALRVLHDTEKPTGLTVTDLAGQFMAWKVNRVRSDRTVADYWRDWTNWLAPTFGHRVASTVDEADVQAWVDAMTAGTLGRRALAAKTVVDHHSLLSSIYSYGVAPSRRLVDRNPCDGTDLPHRQKKPPKGLRPAEWEALHAALRQVDQDAADLAVFLLASGWRISEASALSTFDVEDYGEHGGLYVTMGWVIRRNAAGQHVRVEEGKSEGSLRRVQLDADAAAMVRARVATAPPGGLVFTNGAGKQWHYSNFNNRKWKPAVKAANLSRQPTPHWLRHTAVVWLAMSGASLAELQARIGHQSIATTLSVYGRMLQDVSPTALEGFAAMRSPKALDR